MTRLHGRAPVGELLVARIPHGHCQTRTLTAGVRTSVPYVPCVFEGAMDGESRYRNGQTTASGAVSVAASSPG